LPFCGAGFEVLATAFGCTFLPAAILADLPAAFAAGFTGADAGFFGAILRAPLDATFFATGLDAGCRVASLTFLAAGAGLRAGLAAGLAETDDFLTTGFAAGLREASLAAGFVAGFAALRAGAVDFDADPAAGFLATGLAAGLVSFAKGFALTFFAAAVLFMVPAFDAADLATGFWPLLILRVAGIFIVPP
jgi:hypothetical protein